MLDKAKYKPTELQERLECGGRRVFFRTGNDKDLPPIADGTTPLEDLSERMENLRKYLCDVLAPRLKALYSVRLDNMKHPLAVKSNCKTHQDCLLLYRTHPYGNEIRSLIFFICHKMWGKECMGILEKQVMEVANLEYDGTLVGGKSIKNRRIHGTIKSMFNRVRQTQYVDPYR